MDAPIFRGCRCTPDPLRSRRMADSEADQGEEDWPTTDAGVTYPWLVAQPTPVYGGGTNRQYPRGDSCPSNAHFFDRAGAPNVLSVARTISAAIVLNFSFRRCDSPRKNSNA